MPTHVRPPLSPALTVETAHIQKGMETFFYLLFLYYLASLCRACKDAVFFWCMFFDWIKYFLNVYFRRRKALETNATEHGSVLRHSVLKGISAQIVSAAVRATVHQIISKKGQFY